MKRLLEGTAVRAGVVAAVALAGGLIVASPAAGVATTGSVVTPVTVTAQTAALARPRNGTILYDRISGGQGRLKIRNGLSQDGVVILVRGRTKAISIYVRARSTATVTDVRDGTYRIYFTTGTHFSRSKGRFTRNAVYQRFNDKLKYRTTATRIPGWSLTLNPVRGGNAGTSSVNPKDFPA
ncbi:unnamed protein product [[Actinomadura] parvosata subsp. kistnae]|uniref:hypothetical protein n=1 Tax=[Actinomadura] parvosata TaxID=1955412 RepID=UPI000D2B83CB|nr:hypothetical protein [Nonomuraea sp. ATCC 55076]SPL96524.1 unnamed protein product [Actinomadura parvosata subsp. kistnae]